MRFAGVARVMALASAVGLVGGACVLDPAALDGPIAVNLHVSATPTTVEVDAPGWFAKATGVYVCAAAPPFLPEPGPERIGWTPGDGCHDFGVRPSEDGLIASLPLSELTTEQRATFAAATDWYLYLLKLDGERVDSAVRSRFSAPSGFGAS